MFFGKIYQISPPRGSVAQVKVTDSLSRQPSPLEIVDRFLTSSHLCVKEVVGKFIRLEQLGFPRPLRLFPAWTPRLKLHSGFFGGDSQGIGKTNPFNFHQECEYVPTLTAAETVEDPLFGMDQKRRRLLFVKGTESFHVSPGLFQGHIPSNDIGDIKTRTDLFFCILIRMHTTTNLLGV